VNELQVYVPMTRDDLDLSDLPADGDVTPVLIGGERTKASSPVGAAGPDDTQASVTSHRNIVPTLHTDAIASHGEILAFSRILQSYCTVRLLS